MCWKSLAEAVVADVATVASAQAHPRCRCCLCVYPPAPAAVLVALEHRDLGGDCPQRKARLVQVPLDDGQELSQHQ